MCRYDVPLTDSTVSGSFGFGSSEFFVVGLGERWQARVRVKLPR